MHFVLSAEYEKDYTLRITFEDQVVKRVNLQDHLEGEIYAPLQSIEYFKQFQLHPDLRTVTWPNHADFAPDFLYQIGELVSLKHVG